MSSKMRDLIQYEGISSIPACTTTQDYKQSNLQGILCVPVAKPDVEQVVRVWGKIDVQHYEIVATPVGTSVEGQQLTGCKMMIVGELSFKVQYVACDATRTVHTAHFMVPFCDYIILPKSFNRQFYMKPQAFIEDIHINMMNCRCFFYNVMALFTAKLG